MKEKHGCGFLFLAGLFILTLFALVTLAQAWIVLMGWNHAVVPMFGMNPITYTVALWATVLFNILAGALKSSVSVSK